MYSIYRVAEYCLFVLYDRLTVSFYSVGIVGIVPKLLKYATRVCEYGRILLEAFAEQQKSVAVNRLCLANCG